jgi:RNA polymerase sigma-70 factor (ECF subfamily)
MPQTDWLAVVYQQFRRELLLTAWTVLRRTDLAEDAVQAAFVRLVRLDGPPAEPKLYVFRSVRNAAIDLAKSRTRRREEELQLGWDAPSAEPELPDADVSMLIAELLERMDNAEREVIELHLHAGLTFREMAELLGEPVPTVASRYRRTLDRLAKDIKVRHE